MTVGQLRLLQVSTLVDTLDPRHAWMRAKRPAFDFDFLFSSPWLDDTRKLSEAGRGGFAGVSAAWMPRPSLQGRIHGVPREPTPPGQARLLILLPPYATNQPTATRGCAVGWNNLLPERGMPPSRQRAILTALIPASENACMTTIIAPRVHDIGGLEVRRAVPTLQARSIGSFVFVDQMGPALMHPGTAIDVRPHPHIGLATVTYLWSGAIGHRDTLGSDQVIRPGDVNWMTAGRGIAHSERTPQPDRDHDNPIHGMQTWVALPKSHEEIEPAFYHHAAATLPEQRRNGAWLRVIAGRAYGEESPVKVFADTLNVAIDLDPDAEIDIDDGHRERALYILEGEAQLDGVDIPAQHLVIPEAGARGRLRAKTPVKAMLFGGEPLDGPRHLWWNFVSSSKERIEQAKHDWEAGRFGTIPGDDKEFIPLPEH